MFGRILDVGFWSGFGIDGLGMVVEGIGKGLGMMLEGT